MAGGKINAIGITMVTITNAILDSFSPFRLVSVYNAAFIGFSDPMEAIWNESTYLGCSIVGDKYEKFNVIISTHCSQSIPRQW